MIGEARIEISWRAIRSGIFDKGLLKARSNVDRVTLTACVTVGVLVTSPKTDEGDSGRAVEPHDLVVGNGMRVSVSFSRVCHESGKRARNALR
jgi:hypothetical protein